jgi:3-methyladenine DNA glycosylase AlkD
VFDKHIVFNSKTKNLIDNLMHSTLEEIATLIRTIKLLTLAYKLETKFFYKDNTT